LYWHEGWILPSSMRFHPFPNIPKFVTVKPRLPTEVYLSYSSAAESIFLNFLSWLSNVEHDINIKKSIRMLFQQNCFSNLNYITICNFEKVHSRRTIIPAPLERLITSINMASVYLFNAMARNIIHLNT